MSLRRPVKKIPLCLLEIAPLDKLFPSTTDSFSYFGQAETGALVEIPFGRRTKPGLVLASRPIQQAKLKIKRQDFTLKPITRLLHSPALLGPQQLAFAHWLKNTQRLSLSHALTLCLAWYKKCLDTDLGVHLASATKQRATRPRTNYVTEFNLNSLPRPALVIVPQEESLTCLQAKYPEAVLATPSLATKTFRQLLRQIYTGQPCLYLASKTALFLPWSHLASLALWDEGSKAYKDHFHLPAFDYRYLATKLAELFNIKPVALGHLPSLPTISQLPNWTAILKNNEKKAPRLSKLKQISTTSFNQIEELIRPCRRSLIFTPQTTIARRLTCDQCGAILECPDCHWPYILMENQGQKIRDRRQEIRDKKVGILHCRLCFKNLPLPEICPRCQVGGFKAGGVGAAWIVRYLKKHAQPAHLISTAKQLVETTKKSSFVLIGGYGLLSPFLPPVEKIICLDFDRAFHSPDLFAKEKYYRALGQLATHGQEIYVQSKLDPETFQYLRNGKLLEDILSERKIGFWPPYGRLIILTSRLRSLQTLNARMVAIKLELEKRKKMLKADEALELLGPFLKRLPKRRSQFQLELILKVSHSVNLHKLLAGIRVDEIEVDAGSMS